MGIGSRFNLFTAFPPTHLESVGVALGSLFTDNRPQQCTLRILTITFFLLIAPLPGLYKTAQAADDSSPAVRLLLAEHRTRAVVSGSALIVEKGNAAGWDPVISRIRLAAFSVVQGGVRLEGSDALASAFRIRSPDGLLSFAGLNYRGHLTVLAANGKLMIISNMPLETYLVGVVNGEIDSAWPMDAVMAQVIAARSYALYQVNIGSPYYDLRTDVTDQVYAGAHSEDERAARAVRSTRGEVLYRGEGPVQAFFHSSCGGTTTSALEIWGAGQPEQEGVYCGECGEAPYARWNLILDPSELVSAIRTLSAGVDRVRSLGIHRRTPDGRVQILFADTGRDRILIDAGELRKVIGYRRLRSTRFTLGKIGDRIILTGEGYGHGVGLCQWGARGSAIRGMTYHQILSKYYPGTEIRRAY